MAIGRLETEDDVLQLVRSRLEDYGPAVRELQGRVSRGIHEVVATADLPAAAAENDGRVVVEDAGAGDRNLVIYGGGERFRIDGGAGF